MMTLTATKAVDPDKQTRLERKAERELAAALATWSAAILRGVNSNNIQVMGQRVSDQQWPPNVAMRDALYNVLLRAAEEGGSDGLAAIYGGRTKAISIDPTSVDWELVNTAAARWARSYSHLLMSGISDTTRDMIAGEIAYYVESGISINELRDRIAQSAAFSKQRARRIAVTETTRAYAEGNMAAWADKDYIIGSRWQTANDDLVCPICGPLNQKTARKGELFAGRYYSPPAHVNCRCGLSPVIEGEPGAFDDGVGAGVRVGLNDIASAQQASEWLRGKYPNIDFDFVDIDDALGGRLAKQIDELAQQYPNVARRLEYVGTYRSVSNSSSINTYSFDAAFAHATRDGKQIGLNPEYWSSIEKLTEAKRESHRVKWTDANGTPESIIVHEWGHLVDSNMDRLAEGWHIGDVRRRGGKNDLMYLLHEPRRKAYDSAENISRYATTNYREAFAEAFAQQHERPESEWSDYTRVIDKQIRNFDEVRAMATALEQIDEANATLDQQMRADRLFGTARRLLGW